MRYIVCLFLFLVMNIAGASDFNLSVSQGTVGSNTVLTVKFGEDVRSNDRLSVIDMTDGGVATKNVVLVDADRDGQADMVRLMISSNSKRSLDLSVTAVDSITHAAYCGIGQHWRGSFDGVTPSQGVRFIGRVLFANDTRCQNVETPTLRLRGDAIAVDTALSGVELSILTFVCQETTDLFGACTKTRIAQQMGFASVPLSSVLGNCSVLAQTVYARDRDRVIAGVESFIRLSGYCPHGYIGVGFDTDIPVATTSSPRVMMSVSSFIPRSIIDWIVSKVTKSLGKKVGKEADRALRGCEIPQGLFWKILGVIPYIGDLLMPCVAGG